MKLNKQRSLFLRYFSLCASTVLVSLVILGVLLVILIPQYFKSEKFDLLQKNAAVASNFTEDNYRKNAYRGFTYAELENGYRLIATTSETAVFLVDASGRTLICSDGGQCEHTTYNIPTDTMAEVLTVGWRELGRLGGIYKAPHYSVSQLIRTNDGKIICALIVSTSSSTITSLIKDISKLFLISLLPVLLITAISVYIVTARMVRPLRQMAYATKCFSKGDFSQKIAVSDTSEISELAEAFNNMSTDLANLEMSRRTFIANVSHELKTPMTSIIGFVDGILDGTIEKDNHAYYLNIVSSEAKRLSRIVRSMLSIERIEAGEQKINPTVFDINDVVCKALFSFENKIEEKNLEIKGLDLDEKFYVEADEDLIYQVVYNLIDNAVKFANDNGAITINYLAQNQTTFVGIRNSGEGLSKEECQKIFERFYKTDRSRAKDKNGFGLGLHIVKSIVNLHGGNIFVNSEENKYTEFVFSLTTGKKQKKSGTI